MADLALLTIADAAKLLQGRSLSPVELTQAALRRIETFDREIRAFITVTADRALSQARTAEAEISAGRYRGPMHGIPFGLKDIFNTAGVLTSGNSRIAAGHIPTEDATAAARLLEAGGVLLGKLATWEFAHGIPPFDMPWPPPRNPWNIMCTTGGSSSGSAAAVAAGFALAALGSDTGGSIRGPASLTGIVGLKPTYGLISRTGVIPNSFTFDTCGPMTGTVEDCAIVLQAVAGHDPKDPTSISRPVRDYRSALTGDIRGLRVGVLRHVWEEDLPVGDEVATAMEAALSVLADLGARLEVARIRPIQHYYDVKTVIAESEIFSIHQRDLVEQLTNFGPDFLGRTLAGCLFTAADYVHAQRERRRMLAEVAPLYERFDVLVTSGMGPAPRLDAQGKIDYRDKWSKPNPYTPFNVIGGPALSLRNGFSRDGLPLAMQIIGRPFDEETVLRVGHAYESATPWRHRRPTPPEGATPYPAVSTAPISGAGQIDQATRQQVEVLSALAGLELPMPVFEQLCQVASAVFAMARRLCRDRDWATEPASLFRFPG